MTAEAEVEPASVERPLAPHRRAQQSTTRLSMAAPADIPLPEQAQRSLAGARNHSNAMPKIGESGQQRERRQRTRANRMQPAGSAPAPQTVAVARRSRNRPSGCSQRSMPLTVKAGANRWRTADDGRLTKPQFAELQPIVNLRIRLGEKQPGRTKRNAQHHCWPIATGTRSHFATNDRSRVRAGAGRPGRPIDGRSQQTHR